jgi:hypothetical protein
MKIKDSDYFNSEFMPQFNSSNKKFTSFLQKLGQLWEAMVENILRQDQPKIYVKQNQFGDTYWKIYDPFSQSSKYFKTEQDVRIWLEKRFYS